MVGSSFVGGDLRTPYFNGTNFDFLTVNMEIILIAYDLWAEVEVSILPQSQQNPEIADEYAGEGGEAEHIPGETQNQECQGIEPHSRSIV